MCDVPGFKKGCLCFKTWGLHGERIGLVIDESENVKGQVNVMP